jgi:hypothetical protein
LCAIQAGWAYSQRDHNFGTPINCDALEGWIVDPLLAREQISVHEWVHEDLNG